MAIIMSLVNNKGGVGKTASTSIMAELLALAGKKVLLVDLDGQGNLSMLYHCKDIDSREVIQGRVSADKFNIHEIFKFSLRERDDVKRIIRKTEYENIDIIPSSKRHKGTGNLIQLMKMNSTGNTSIILKKALDSIRDEYDYIFIDNAPQIDDMTVNTIFASDYILVPVRTEGFSREGLIEILDEIKYIKEEHFIKNGELLGTFMTQVQGNTNVFRDLNENYEDELKDQYLHTPIRSDIKVAEMATFYTPLLANPNSNALGDYAELILEINTKIDFIDEETANLLKVGLAKED